VGVAPQWALDLEPLAKTPVQAMMPLQGVFQWWRTVGAPEKGVAVSLGFPLDWTADTQTMGGERWGTDTCYHGIEYCRRVPRSYTLRWDSPPPSPAVVQIGERLRER
jgi:hypothetical protein